VSSLAWPLLLLLLEGAGGQAGTAATCPPADELRRALNVKRADAPTACRVLEHDITLMAAVVPPAGKIAGRVVIALSFNGHRRRGQTTLPKKVSQQLPAQADRWTIDVAPAHLNGAHWFRVDVTATAGQELTTQTIVSYFTERRRTFRHLWTGLGDRHERHWDACQLDTASSFRLLDDGALFRERSTTRAFRDPGLAAEQLAVLDRECVAGPPTRDTFTVPEDGIDADVAIPDDLRAAARENWILSLQARSSPEALGQFLTSSLALVPRLEHALMSGDPQVENASIEVTGASAYFMDSGGRSGLDWSRILEIVASPGQPLARALEQLRNDEGAWVEARTDYGGCHKPELAEEPLRQLVAAWQAAPEAYRKAFEPILAADLREMSRFDCVCAKPGQRRELQRALDRNAAIIQPLPGGPEAARALRGITSGDGVHFDCSPG